jgi:hypothetical protein
MRLPSVSLAKRVNHKFGYANKLKYLLGLPIRPAWAPHYVPGSYPSRVLNQVMDWTFREIRANGAEPIVLILATDLDIDYFMASGKKVYQPLLDYVATQNVMSFDALDFFHDVYGRKLISGGLYKVHHYSEKANAIVADGIIKTIEPRLQSTAATASAPQSEVANPE